MSKEGVSVGAVALFRKLDVRRVLYPCYVIEELRNWLGEIEKTLQNLKVDGKITIAYIRSL